MIKKIIAVSTICSFFNSYSFAQITIRGNISNPGVLTLETFPVKRIGNIAIRNHVGLKKNSLKKANGILLKDGLNQFTLNDTLPKNYSRYVYTITASDGYTVTFSWNELYNNNVGKKVFLVTHSKSHPKDGIILISKSDRFTGRRFVKDVVEINIERK
jgi:hypothetical protein